MNAPPAAGVEALKALYPRAFGPPAWVRALRWAFAALVLLYLLWLMARMGFTPERLGPGVSKLGAFVSRMFPPSDNGFLMEILKALAETVAMAFLGTFIAALLALPLGFLGAKTVFANPVGHFALRRVYDFFRGVPALIWALIFVRAVGLGPMAGVLALVATDFAALSKLTAEAVENADRKAGEAVKASGAAPLLVLRFGTLPQVLPVYLSQVLYFFESNVRSSAILGIVGAGGIGFQLAERARSHIWDGVAFIVILFIVVVALIDTGSRALRRRLIEAGLSAREKVRPPSPS